MKRALIGILKALLPLVIVAAAGFAALTMIMNRPPVETLTPVIEPPGVRVHEVTLTDAPLSVTSQGTVRPRTESQLVPEIAGRVTWVAPSFAEGGFFEADDVLVRIDPFDYEQALVSARSQLAQARLRLAEEEAEAEVAQREWNALGRGDPRELALRKPQLEDARASVAAAEAGVERATRDLQRAEIVAPYAGRVRTKNVDIGQYVRVGDALATVYAVDIAEIRLPLPDDELAYLDLPLSYRGVERQAQPDVTLRATFAGETHVWNGRIVRTESEIDSVSRMVHAVAEVEDPYAPGPNPNRPPLAVGMYVEAEIGGRTARDVAVLPRQALRGREQVLVVTPEDRLSFRSVDVLRTSTESVILQDGLQAGELVVISPLDTPTDGMQVQLADADPDLLARRAAAAAAAEPAPGQDPAAVAATDGLVDPADDGPAVAPAPADTVAAAEPAPADTLAPAVAAVEPPPAGAVRRAPAGLSRPGRPASTSTGPGGTARRAPAGPSRPGRPASADAPAAVPPARAAIVPAEQPATGDAGPGSTPPGGGGERPAWLASLLGEGRPAEERAMAGGAPAPARPRSIEPASTRARTPPRAPGPDVDLTPRRAPRALAGRPPSAPVAPFVERAADPNAVAVASFATLNQGGGAPGLGPALSRAVAASLASADGLTLAENESDARYVVRGGIQQVGPLVRVTARIVDTAGGAVVHAAKIDGTSENRPALAADVAAAIVAHLPVSLPSTAPLSSAPGAVPAGGTRRALAVLPFDDLSAGAAPGPDVDLGTAITEAVAEQVATLQAVALVTPGDEAAWAIGGGIQRLGSLVRVTARLIDVRSGEVVTAVKIDGSVEALADLQSRVAAAMIESVRDALSGRSVARLGAGIDVAARRQGGRRS